MMTSRKPTGYKVPPSSIRDLRNLAHQLRKVLDIDKPYFPIVEATEILTADEIFDFEIVSNGSLGEDLGQTFLIKSEDGLIPCIRITEEAYENACRDHWVHRFTIAHEVGHAIIHPHALRFSRSTTHRENKLFYMDSEWQANRFATELLMDIRYISSDDTVESISEKFCVSQYAAHFRLEDLIKKGSLTQQS